MRLIKWNVMAAIILLKSVDRIFVIVSEIYKRLDNIEQRLNSLEKDQL